MLTKLIHIEAEKPELPQFIYICECIKKLPDGEKLWITKNNGWHEWMLEKEAEFRAGSLLLEQFNDFADKLSKDHKRMIGDKNGW